MTPFTIAFVKLISNYDYNEEVKVKTNPIKVGVSTTIKKPQEPIKQEEPKQTLKIEKKTEEKTKNKWLDVWDITDVFGDLDDVFWWSDNSQNIQPREEKKEVSSPSWLPFEIKDLTVIISKTKWMAMVSSWLKQATCNIQNGVFIASISNSLVYNKLNKVESIDVIRNALSELWHDLTVEIKKT